VSILYPIAADASQALTAPLGRAARETDAARLASEPVAFVREFTGPAFRSEDEARNAHAGRLDDARPNARTTVAPEDRYCELRPIAQRSLIPFAPPHTVWRLSVAYWRVGEIKAQAPDLPQARKAKRATKGDAPDGRTLNAFAEQPLRPVRAQQPLDFGLFEVPLPENPQLTIPDE
jgi:hypothetical protein